tara:strand:- start:3964 stop:4503 length:540 start_codon:yes stop_codon:yes gene_type:complete
MSKIDELVGHGIASYKGTMIDEEAYEEARAALHTALQELTAQPKCVCGENTLGIVHRADGPCYWPTEPHVAVAAIQPAQPEQVSIREVVVNADYRAMWAEMVAQNQKLCAALQSAQPVAQHERKTEAEKIAYRDGFLWALETMLDAPVEQPLTWPPIETAPKETLVFIGAYVDGVWKNG